MLVATEISLKDRLPTFDMGHDISSLVQKLFSPPPTGLQAQLIALQVALQVMFCTHKNQRAPVKPEQYPGVRYLRLEKDGFTGDTTDAQVQQALDEARRLVDELRRNGVAV